MYVDLRLEAPRSLLKSLVILCCACCAAWTGGPAEAQPASLPGLQDDAQVVYDSNGIPHICGTNDRDVFFLQGWVHARDRFFQMDLLRRQFSGTLTELLGAGALASDVQFRNLGLRRAAEASWAAYADAGLDGTVELVEVYTRGVNAYLATHPLPPEYAALELSKADPWTPVDSVVMSKGLAFGLSFDLIEIDLTIDLAAYTVAGTALGFDGAALLFEDVSRPAPFDPTISIPLPPISSSASPAKIDLAQIPAPDATTVKLARQFRDKIAEIPLLKKALERRVDDRGSNWWLVAGAMSTSGFPMLANDPHLGLNTPSTFYENHLVSSSTPGCGFGAAGASLFSAPRGEAGGEQAVKGLAAESGLNVNGVSFAGAPGVVLGCNDEACWGATVHPMDVTDVYQELLVLDPITGLPSATLFDGELEPVVILPNRFRVNQLGDGTPDNLEDAPVGPLDGGFTLIVPRRNNGPVVSIVSSTDGQVSALSVQYTGFGPTFELEAFRRWQKVGTLEEFRSALQYFDVGSQNWSFANVHGDIAYFTSAELPIREDLQTLNAPDGGIPPFLIRDGTHTLKHEWLAVQNPQPQQALPWEILPFNEMPQLVNPPQGFIINANNDPVGTTLDNNPLNQVRPGGGLYYLNVGYADGLRVGRIGRLMNQALADGSVTVDEMEAMQANNQLLDAELVVPFVLQAFANAQVSTAPAELNAFVKDPGVAEAVTRLMAWDFSSPTGLARGYDPGDDPDNLPQPSAEEIANSVAATIWSAFRGQATLNIIDAALVARGLGDFRPGGGLAYRALYHLLSTFDAGQGVGASGVDFFPAPGGFTREQARDLHLLQNLRAALDLLASDGFAGAFDNSTDQDDYRWGYLHRIVYDHPLSGPFDIPPAGVPGAGGFQDVAPGLRGVARSGGFEAVDASSHGARASTLDGFMFGSGPARRFVGVLDPSGIQGQQVIPGGQSGVLGSPHYASQLGRWLTNDYHPLLLTAGAVQADAVTRQEFTPGCAPGPRTLCFQDRRFRVTATWSAPLFGAGPGRAVPGSSGKSGNLYFFDPENWEMLVKVLDGCSVNGHYWVFASGATDLSWELTVEDTETDEVWTASNPLGQRSPAITDTTAFATCP